jgi:cytochrome c oxidase assembly protein subunit 15
MTRSSARFPRYAWVVLGYTVLVAVWGAFVRATGSGAGCGNHWPLCNGEVMPREPALETVIELSHRLSSGILGPMAIVLAWWAVRRFGARHRVALAAIAGLVLTLVEGLLGAGLVRFELVAGNASIARGFVMAAHLVNTFFLLAAMALTAAWSAGTGAPGRPGARASTGESSRLGGAAPWLAIGALAALCLLGASGGVTALGDTLFPVSEMTDEAIAGLPASAELLVRLRTLHPWLAVAVALYLGLTVLAVRERFPGRRHGRLHRLGTGLVALLGIELAAGLLNVALAAPVWLQLVHLGLAYLVWITTVLLTAELLATPVEDRASPRPAPST